MSNVDRVFIMRVLLINGKYEHTLLSVWIVASLLSIRRAYTLIDIFCYVFWRGIDMNLIPLLIFTVGDNNQEGQTRRR